jgi:hypothetical protein
VLHTQEPKIEIYVIGVFQNKDKPRHVLCSKTIHTPILLSITKSMSSIEILLHKNDDIHIECALIMENITSVVVAPPSS